MKTKFILLTALAGALCSTPAFAGPVAGPRMEAIAGWDSMTINGKATGDGKWSKSGLYYGVGAGYDFAVAKNFSVGIDGELAGSTVRGNDQGAWLHVGRDLYVGVRGTASVAQSTNVYVKAGYANARAKLGLGAATLASANNSNLRAGIGVQQNFSENFYGLVEYRYTFPGDGMSRNQIITGLGLRF